jgi:hypothetical protein
VNVAGALGRRSLGERNTPAARGDHIEDALDARVTPPRLERLVARELGLDGDRSLRFLRAHTNAVAFSEKYSARNRD